MREELTVRDLDRLHDPGIVRQMITQHQELHAFLRQNIDTYREQHPDQWVGLGMDRQPVFAATLEFLITEPLEIVL